MTRNVSAYVTLPPRELAREECKETAAKVEEREGTVGFLIMPGAYCTATLISPHVVITAGHCVTSSPPQNIRFSLAADMGQKQEVF